MAAILGLLAAKQEGDKSQVQAQSAADKASEKRSQNELQTGAQDQTRLQLAVEKSVGKREPTPSLLADNPEVKLPETKPLFDDGGRLASAIGALEQLKGAADPLDNPIRQTAANSATMEAQRDAYLRRKKREADEAQQNAISARSSSNSNRRSNAVKSKQRMKLGSL